MACIAAQDGGAIVRVLSLPGACSCQREGVCGHLASDGPAGNHHDGTVPLDDYCICCLHALWCSSLHQELYLATQGLGKCNNNHTMCQGLVEGQLEQEPM